MELKIAEIGIKIEGFCPESVKKPLEPYLRAGRDVREEITISIILREEIAAEEYDESYGIRRFVGEYGRAGEREFMQSVHRGRVIAKASYGKGYKNIVNEIVDVEKEGGSGLGERIRVLIKDNVMNALPSAGGITFHSSAIEIGGEAILFAAPSGTGKSTQSRLWKEAYGERVRYINDDAPIIRAENGVVYAYGSPWAGRSGINENISGKVRGIIYIERGEGNEIRELGKMESALRLMRSAREQFFPTERKKQLEIEREILESVKIYALRCEANEGAVKVAAAALGI